MSPVLDTLAPVFGLCLLGYLAARLRWFSDQAADGLARFVFDFAVPVMLVRVLSQAQLPGFFPWRLLVCFYLPAGLLYAAGILVSRRVFHRDFGEQVITGFSCSFGNSVLLGLPIALLSLDQAAMVPFFILLSVHGLGYFTVTTTLLEYARHHQQPLARLGLGVAKGLVTNPIILGLGGGVVMNLTGLTLPAPVDRTAEYLQSAVTPCALFSLGASLTRYQVVGALAEPLFAVSLKNLAMPTLVWLSGQYLLGLAPPWTAAATLLAAQPSGVNVYLFAERYSAAKGLATTTVFLSTSLSILSISALLYLIQ